MIKRLVINGKLVTRKEIKNIVGENSCLVSTIFANNVPTHHEWEFIDYYVEIRNIHGELGVKVIIVDIHHKYYCKNCLVQKDIVVDSKNLMETSNWAAEMKRIANKYKGKINVVNIDRRK